MSGSGSSVFALTNGEVSPLRRRFLAEFGETLFSTPFSVANAVL